MVIRFADLLRSCTNFIRWKWNIVSSYRGSFRQLGPIWRLFSNYKSTIHYCHLISLWLVWGFLNKWRIWNKNEIVKVWISITFPQEISKWFIDRNVNEKDNRMIENQNDVIIFRLNIESSHHSILLFIISILSSECFQMTSLYFIWLDFISFLAIFIQEIKDLIAVFWFSLSNSDSILNKLPYILKIFNYCWTSRYNVR
jgi:hypothetical protein